MAAAPTTIRWLVSGRVQGVGFRWFVRKAAVELGLDGTVRNLADGRVEVHARGDRDSLDRLEQQLGRGPALSRVDELTRVALDEAVELPAGFRITDR